MAGARQLVWIFPVSIHTVLGIALAGTELYSNAINSIQQRGVLHGHFTCVYNQRYK